MSMFVSQDGSKNQVKKAVKLILKWNFIKIKQYNVVSKQLTGDRRVGFAIFSAFTNDQWFVFLAFL